MKQGAAALIANAVTVAVAQLPTADMALRAGQIFAVYASGLLSVAMGVHYVMKTIREGRHVTLELARIARENARAIEAQAHITESKQVTIDPKTLGKQMDKAHDE